MVLAHYFREDGREEARAEIEKVLADTQQIQAENDALRRRLNQLEHKKMQAELEDLRKRVDALEAARGKQADG